MGWYWEKVHSLPKGRVLIVPGQLDSPPKRWWNLWRLKQKKVHH